MQRSLVIQLARFGDLVQTKRLVRTLALRGHEVHLCVDVSLEKLTAMVYSDARVHAILAHAAGFTGPGAMGRLVEQNRRSFARLAALGFDEVYTCNYTGLAFAISRLFDPAIVRGYRSDAGQRLKDTWAAMAFRWTRDRAMSAINLVDFWAGLAAGSEPLAPAPGVNPPAVPRGGGVGVVLAGRNSRRSLPMDVLARAAQAALGRVAEKRLVLLGSAAEAPLGEELLATLPQGVASRTENLAGKTDWQGLAEALKPLDTVLTPDTGTMHLAAHLGVPVTAFFLSSAWCFETGPYGEGHTVWQSICDCSPCLESSACGHGLACLEPMAGTDLPRALASGKSPRDERLVGLVSTVDDLGTYYEPNFGTDNCREARKRFRAFLSRHLHTGDSWLRTPCPDFAERLYHEKDWMVPDARDRELSDMVM